MTPQAKKKAVAWLSVISNTVLIGGKVTVGLIIGSVSVISEAIHSGVDLLAAIIALYAVSHSHKPADEQHPFGHGKLENLSGTIEALLIFAAAAWILYEAGKKLLYPGEIEQIGVGVGVMAFSACANMVVSRMLFRVGRETDSLALQADAWHLRTDVWTSAGVMVGLALIWVGDWVIGIFPDIPADRRHYWQNLLHIIDPVAAIIVAGLIIRAAWHLTVQSAGGLMDVTLPEEEQEWIRQTLSQFAPEIHGYHQMRTRKSGAQRFVEFHIFVDARMTVQDSHELAHRVSGKIKEHFADSSVLVHVEPCGGRCEACKANCLLPNPRRREDEGDKKPS